MNIPLNAYVVLRNIMRDLVVQSPSISSLKTFQFYTLGTGEGEN